MRYDNVNDTTSTALYTSTVPEAKVYSLTDRSLFNPEGIEMRAIQLDSQPHGPSP